MLNLMTARNFRRFGVFTIGYTIAVIIYGAWVRITGSGAGCGRHWPRCHGVTIPRSPTAETIVEFTHRVTSGLALLFVLLLLALAIRAFRRGHPARRWSYLIVFFMITEALVGAGLVLFGLVENDDSVARAAVMSVHLVNTFLLTGSMSLAVFWGGRVAPTTTTARRTSAYVLVVAFSAVVLLFMGMTGAVTALGDTLYPVDPATGQHLMDRLALEQHPTAHFLVRMRVLHPIIAVLGAVGVALTTLGIAHREEDGAVRRWGRATAALLTLQIFVGFVNIGLHAPGWMQLIHLGIANVIWVAFVFFSAALLEDEQARTEQRVGEGLFA